MVPYLLVVLFVVAGLAIFRRKIESDSFGRKDARQSKQMVRIFFFTTGTIIATAFILVVAGLLLQTETNFSLYGLTLLISVLGSLLVNGGPEIHEA
ncbi:MAG: hypothetical protein M0P64_02000 [Candidatus Pacebacteria bacterium]|jgi:hypothetical protein|nr:hypothetical protein [Candidatus Paceibacterota bacterium]